MDLIIKVSGEVQANNLAEYEENALKIIDSINTDLQTDEDFGEADNNVKKCKEVETKLWQAKQNATNSMQSISDLFLLIDKLSDKFRDTRLDLTRKIKTEKESRKVEILNDAKSSISAIIKESSVSHVFNVPAGIFENSIKGKRSFSAMQEAVNEAVCDLETEIIELSELFDKNIIAVIDAEKEYPGLFYDKLQFCLKSESEVFAIITGRISNFKLRQLEKKAKKEKRERIAAEEAEVKEAIRKTEIQHDEPETVLVVPKQTEYKIELQYTGTYDEAQNLGLKICKLFPVIDGFYVL